MAKKVPSAQEDFFVFAPFWNKNWSVLFWKKVQIIASHCVLIEVKQNAFRIKGRENGNCVLSESLLVEIIQNHNKTTRILSKTFTLINFERNLLKVANLLFKFNLIVCNLPSKLRWITPRQPSVKICCSFCVCVSVPVRHFLLSGTAKAAFSDFPSKIRVFRRWLVQIRVSRRGFTEIW